MKFALTGARIFDGYCFHDNAALLINGVTIDAIVPTTSIDSGYTQVSVDQGILTPGFIDLQINGAGGVLLNNAPNRATMITMVNAIAQFGVTRILPTVISDDPAITLQAIDAAQDLIGDHSGVLGLHIEGPFFSLEKNGVHRPEKIRSLTDEDWNWLKALSENPAIVTLAPEIVTPEQIQQIARLGIRICAGHTNATYEQVLRAHQHGLSGFTHLFNAMSQLTGREPGVVGAALSLPATRAGLIADGIHVHAASMQTAIQAKGFENIFLVSDAMATVGSEQKIFELYGEKIEEKNGQLVNSQGRLAGAAISLIDAVRYCVSELHWPLNQVLAMASRIPAEYMQVEQRFGTFNVGSIADICWLSDELSVEKVWRAGELISSRND